MNNSINIGKIFGWFFGLLLFTIGILNLFLVHPVPGIAYMLLSFLFYPTTNPFLKRTMGFSIPVFVKIIMGVIIMWFTLGISDLAEMYGL